MTSRSAKEYATEFLSMSVADQEQWICKTQKMLSNPSSYDEKSLELFDVNGSMKVLTETHPQNQREFRNFTVTLLNLGRVQHFLNINAELQSKIVDWQTWGHDVEVFFLLQEIELDFNPVTIQFDRGLSYLVFLATVKVEFPFLHIGSDDFTNLLHEYFAINGRWTGVQGNSLYSHTHDWHLFQTIIILRRKYGESAVSKMFENVIRHELISPRDLILLMSAEKDVSDLPLEWALNIVR